MLIYQKTAPLQTLHGLSFGLSQTKGQLLDSSAAAGFAVGFARDGNEA